MTGGASPGRAPSEASAWAPATVGNVAVGFDILGHTLPVIGDTVTVRRVPEPGVRITAVRGLATDMPLDPSLNTAGKALLSLLAEGGQAGGFELEIDKGIPLGSGLGGSAASAVAAVVAANVLLEAPQDLLALLRHAMQGESAASGSLHADNVAPSLFGGLVLTVGTAEPRVKRVPVPPAIRCVAVHPRMFIATREARSMLQPHVRLEDMVRQSANLAGFLAACYTGDLELLRASFRDVVIEPQRARLIPGFDSVRRAALEAGALGCSISGSGPTVFAWCEESDAAKAARAMVAGFAQQQLDCDHWVSAIGTEGARILRRQ